MITLLKFYADWCGPCKGMAPVVNQLVAEESGILLRSVNIDNDPQLRLDYNIRSIPAFVLLRDGEEIGRKIGSGTLEEMKEFVSEHRGV